MKHWNEQTQEIANVINEASKREGIQWTRVTWYSWWLAIFFFALVLPALSFYIGTQYQLTKDVVRDVSGERWKSEVVIPASPEEENPNVVSPSTPTPTDGAGVVACTMDAKICPDGSYVGRTGPHCEFAPCPNTAGVVSEEDIPVPM